MLTLLKMLLVHVNMLDMNKFQVSTELTYDYTCRGKFSLRRVEIDPALSFVTLGTLRLFRLFHVRRWQLTPWVAPTLPPPRGTPSSSCSLCPRVTKMSWALRLVGGV
jgi:hypothetical protein